MKWTQVDKDGEGHRLFDNDPDNVASRFGDAAPSELKWRFAVADRSGLTPETTDDGPLFLVPQGDAEIVISGKRVRVQYDVQKQGSEVSFFTTSGLQFLPWLVKLGYVVRCKEELKRDMLCALSSLIREERRGD